MYVFTLAEILLFSYAQQETTEIIGGNVAMMMNPHQIILHISYVFPGELKPLMP